jgi:hypothetical protein
MSVFATASLSRPPSLRVWFWRRKLHVGLRDTNRIFGRERSTLRLTVAAILFGVLALGQMAGQTDRETINVFAFDDYTIPFKQNLFLTMVAAKKYPGNPVLSYGPAGSPDAQEAAFDGSIIRVDGKYRMWYTARAKRDTDMSSYRPAYAESTDGIHWIKPQLGLVDFNGNNKNNLLQFSPTINFALSQPIACFVLYEPSDPDPSRRYKMTLYDHYVPSNDPAHKNGRSTICPYFSADGLRWKLAVPPPQGDLLTEKEDPLHMRGVFELAGLYRFKGIYYVPGHEFWDDASMPNGQKAGRIMITHWSSDFVHWSKDQAFSFARWGYRSVKDVNEAHGPGSIWNRGNVLLGTYGIWYGEGKPENWRLSLGFIISNDGIHFREPEPDFVLLPAGADGEWDQRGLENGQGYENIGDQTYMYYSSWDLSADFQNKFPHSSIGLATLRRDGFGYLSTLHDGEAQLTSTVIAFPHGFSGVRLNADGLGDDSSLRLELLDASGNPLPGYSAVVVQSGVSVPVSWKQTLSTLKPGGYRLRVHFDGNNRKAIHLYAIYVDQAQ